MYGTQFMCHTRGRQGQKYSSLQFWRGRIKIASVGDEHRLYVGCSCAFCCLKERKIAYGKKENRFLSYHWNDLILHLTACTNRSSELPAPDSTVFGYEGETKSYLMECARNIMIKKKRIKCFCQLCRF